MKIAVVTFDGCNELDSLVVSNILNRVSLPNWRAEITAPTATITSMNGVTITAQKPLEFANEADAVIIGSGRKTREMVADEKIMSRLKLDPKRQIIASQCSGALLLIHLGLVNDMPICTDRKTQTWVAAAGYKVLDGPFYARENIAMAGGCLASTYLATWIIWSMAGKQAAIDALNYVLPHSEEEEYLQRALKHVEPFISQQAMISKA